MGKYFILPLVINRLCEMGIEIVGTWMVGEFGTLGGRWMDNGMGCDVSAIHRVGKTGQRSRK
eukprot:6284185-Ditylum_brightwellii.AAC.1